MQPRKPKRGPPKRPKASASEIIGSANPARIRPKWRRQYQRLIDLREKLRHRKGELSEAAKQERPVFSLHMADAGTDQYDQDFALSMISSEQSALYEIDQALTRIQGGTYGVCELTGQPIEMDRLEAIPWTRFSLGAQKELEERGAVKRTKLGKAGSLTASESGDESASEQA